MLVHIIKMHILHAWPPRAETTTANRFELSSYITILHSTLQLKISMHIGQAIYTNTEAGCTRCITCNKKSIKHIIPDGQKNSNV